MKRRYYSHSPKRVALVCMGPSATDFLTKTLTQEYDPKWVDEVWVINMAVNPFRADVVFWMDDLVDQQEFKPKLFDALRKFKTPVITSVRRPEVVPNSYDYPIDEVAAFAVPIFGKPYLNNGVAMAIAYAMYKGVQEMWIYGADFSYPNRDYAESGRACVECWLTVAGMQGMDIKLCPNTSLMDSVKDHGIYGYKDQPEVKLPDGRVFQYKRLSEVMGKYVPAPGYVAEDSSGVKNGQLQNSVPGNGRPAPVVARRRTGAHEAARIAAATTIGPSPSVRGGATTAANQAELHQGANLALHDSGGRAGRIQAGTQVALSPVARTVGPRRKDAQPGTAAGARNPHRAAQKS